MATPVRRQYQIYIERPPETVFAFLLDLKNHARLCPEEALEEAFAQEAAPLSEGSRVLLRGGLWRERMVTVCDWTPPHGFVLRQAEGGWSLRRRMVPFQEGALFTEVYEYPAGPLGTLGERFGPGKRLDDWARFRQNELKRILERIGRIKGPGQ